MSQIENATLQMFERLGRVFINPAVGCRSKCQFCYVAELGFDRLYISDESGDQIRKQLLTHPMFVAGPYGTLISFSPDTEAFDTVTIPKTLSFIAALSKLGNPMQIATRRCVDVSTLESIRSLLTSNNQLTLFISSSTISYHAILETGTMIPQKRFETFEVCRRIGLPACLLVKPFIPGLTDQDTESYISVIQQFGIEYCCIGIFYASQTILKRINKKLAEIKVPRIAVQHKGNTLPFSDTMKPISYSEKYADFEVALQSTGARVHRNTVCVVADILEIACPQANWIRFPSLCVQCQDCAALAQQHVPPALKRY